MGFFNVEKKSFITKNKQHDKQVQMPPDGCFNCDFNNKLINNNNAYFIKNKSHTNEAVQNNIIPNQYFRPNEAYKQNQLNNMEMLYKNNNIIHPTRMNLNNQHNLYADNGKYQYLENNQRNINTATSQMLPGYIETYYNHDAAQNYTQPMKQQVLPQQIKQYSSDCNYDPYLSESHNQTRCYKKEFMKHKNKHNDCFNCDNVCVGKCYCPYKRQIISPHNQSQFNHSEKENCDYDCHKLNSSKYFDNNHMMINSISTLPSVYQKNNFNCIPSVQFNTQTLTDSTKGNCYNCQPKLSNKQHYHRFNKKYTNKLIPLEVAREIRFEKARNLIMTIVGSLKIVITSLFIVLYFVCYQQELEAIMGVQAKYIPHPFLMVVFLLISLGLLFAGIFGLSRVKIETNNYLSNLIRSNYIIPHFLVNNYKKMTVHGIILNWLAFSIYFFGGVVLGILYWFQQYSGKKFSFGFWSWGVVNDLTTAIMITIIILIVTLGIHIANIVLTKNRKANIISYCGCKIISPEELATLKKKTNRICLIVFIAFLVVLTIIISIPWLITHYRKRSGEPLLKFKRLFNQN